MLFFYNPVPPRMPNIATQGSVVLWAARINDGAFTAMYDKLSDEPLVVRYHDDTTIKGDITAKNGGLMFTSIPFDRRWHIYVDGIERPAVKVMDALLGLPLDEGSFQIEMKYEPDRLGWTYILSFAALAYLIVQKMAKGRLKL